MGEQQVKSQIPTIASRNTVIATALAAALLLAANSAARSQVVVFVNGEPVTALDIEQRSKFIQLTTKKRQPPRKHSTASSTRFWK